MVGKGKRKRRNRESRTRAPRRAFVPATNRQLGTALCLTTGPEPERELRIGLWAGQSLISALKYRRQVLRSGSVGSPCESAVFAHFARRA